MSKEQDYGEGRLKLDWEKKRGILWPYIAQRVGEQISSVAFIILYLIFFQLIILGLPIVYSLTISFGVLMVILGLTLFMEGLKIGLMPFGETIGVTLPQKTKLPTILIFALLVGVSATLAEPAIEVLRQAGKTISPEEAPLLHSLLNDFKNELVASVGIGVGLAVMFGVLRFLYNWSLKTLIIPLVSLLTVLTLYAHFHEALRVVVGMAWDCGAVTTGPVTVPLVLALGIGVCRIVSKEDSDNSGFGIVTLASLFPIIAVFVLSFYHVLKDDYYGRPHFIPKEGISYEVKKKEMTPIAVEKGFSEKEFQEILANKNLLASDFSLSFSGGSLSLENGKIHHQGASIVYEKPQESSVDTSNLNFWDPGTPMLKSFRDSFLGSLRAIVPLCLFLYLTLRLLLREKVAHADTVFLGILFSIAGMAIFLLGISLGLTPLGEQLGSNVPSTFSNILPWNLGGVKKAMFEGGVGKLVASLFAFFLGYGATLAEPALNALGETVEKITIGAFKKSLLMKTVAIGVGSGIALGILKIAYNIPLAYLLLPPYLLLLVLTIISSEEFVNFGWDSAGVTTGPITVPLVLAMGLGVGSNVPNVIDGFGVLALASVAPIISVLTVGLVVEKSNTQTKKEVKND